MRLLSYNIHKGIGGQDRRYRLDRILDVIRHENPDLICLQEVSRGAPRSYGHDQSRLMAGYMEAFADLFQLNVHWKEGGYGNQILSRWPLLNPHQILLKFENKKARGGQIATVETPEGPLLLVNWHLGLGELERHWQVGHLLGHPRFLESAHLPAILAGDFNDWRDTLAIGPLSALGFLQATSPPSRFRSFPAYHPVASLDKAFHRGSVILHQARIVHSRMTRTASDHLPLVVDFSLGASVPAP